MRRRSQRLIVIAAAGALVALAVTLTLAGLRDSVTFFVTPSNIASKAKSGEHVRLGGLVETGSFKRAGDGAVMFAVTDNKSSIGVHYDGLLPDLFGEGRGVIAEGVRRPDGVFEADRVLAKHDEKYMPREVAEALKKSGEWKGDAP
jgi:cytochrome c-type biogenesis protein CcmE